MGLVVLSIMLSIILGCCVWLVIGEKLPLGEGEGEKWPVMNNILCYGLLLVVPVYLAFFFTY